MMCVRRCGHMCAGQAAIQGMSVRLRPACPLTRHLRDTLRQERVSSLVLDLQMGTLPTNVAFPVQDPV